MVALRGHCSLNLARIQISALYVRHFAEDIDSGNISARTSSHLCALYATLGQQKQSNATLRRHIEPCSHGKLCGTAEFKSVKLRIVTYKLINLSKLYLWVKSSTECLPFVLTRNSATLTRGRESPRTAIVLRLGKDGKHRERKRTKKAKIKKNIYFPARSSLPFKVFHLVSLKM
jgi:hypothetical protein